MSAPKAASVLLTPQVMSSALTSGTPHFRIQCPLCIFSCGSDGSPKLNISRTKLFLKVHQTFLPNLRHPSTHQFPLKPRRCCAFSHSASPDSSSPSVAKPVLAFPPGLQKPSAESPATHSPLRSQDTHQIVLLPSSKCSSGCRGWNKARLLVVAFHQSLAGPTLQPPVTPGSPTPLAPVLRALRVARPDFTQDLCTCPSLCLGRSCPRPFCTTGSTHPAQMSPPHPRKI